MRKSMIVRVTATEFETDQGRVFPHPVPFEEGTVPSVEEFQKWYDRCWFMLFGAESGQTPEGDDGMTDAGSCSSGLSLDRPQRETMPKKDKLLTLGKASAMLGVHRDTLRNWSDEGKIKSIRTPGGHRKFPLSEVQKHMGTETPVEESANRTVIYCRVSSHDQKKKGDLERQVGRVTAHCVQEGYALVEVLQDVGSGMSTTRPRLRKLFKMVNDHQIDRVVVEHKDRLTRFGFSLLQAYFESHGVVIEGTEETLGKAYEEELVEDILSLMPVSMASAPLKTGGKERMIPEPKCPKCGGDPGTMYSHPMQADCKDCEHRFAIILDGQPIITPIPHEEAGRLRNWSPPETLIPSIRKVDE